ncbi:MAG: hypothetical protein ACE5ID_11700 [Acidobacteriota bacterium]
MAPSPSGDEGRERDLRATLVLEALSLGCLPAWWLAITGLLGQTLGPVRWAALIFPPAITACLLLACTFVAVRGRMPLDGKHGSRVIFPVFGALYLIMVAVLALPSFIPAGLSPSTRLMSSSAQQAEQVLRQRAMQHPRASQRLHAARKLYLIHGETVTYMGPTGRPQAFRPGRQDLILQILNRWLLSRFAAAPEERYWLALADMAIICFFLTALPAVAYLARRSAL